MRGKSLTKDWSARLVIRLIDPVAVAERSGVITIREMVNGHLQRAQHTTCQPL